MSPFGHFGAESSAFEASGGQRRPLHPEPPLIVVALVVVVDSRLRKHESPGKTTYVKDVGLKDNTYICLPKT